MGKRLTPRQQRPDVPAIFGADGLLSALRAAEYLSVYRGVSATLAIQIFGALLGFALQIFFARSLGVEAYGVYVLALSSTSVALLLARGGLDKAAVRFMPEYMAQGDPGLARAFSTISLVLVAGAGLLVTAVFMLVTWAVDATTSAGTSAFFAAALTILPLALLQTAQAQLRGLGRVVLAVAPEAVCQPLMFAFVIVTLSLTTTITPSLIFATFAGTTGLAFLALIFRLNSLTPPREQVSAPWRQWLLTGGGLVLVGGANVLWTEADSLLLGILAGSREVGQYAIPLRLSAGLSILPSAIGLVIAPILVRHLSTGGRREAQRLVTSTTRLSAFFIIFAGIGLLLIGGSLLEALGRDFRAGYSALAILVVGQVVYVLCGPAEVLLAVRGQQLALSRLLLLGAVLNVCLCLLLIPGLGATGAAIGASLSRCIESVLAQRVVMQRLGLRTRIAFTPRSLEHDLPS